MTDPSRGFYATNKSEVKIKVFITSFLPPLHTSVSAIHITAFTYTLIQCSTINYSCTMHRNPIHRSPTYPYTSQQVTTNPSSYSAKSSTLLLHTSVYLPPLICQRLSQPSSISVQLCSLYQKQALPASNASTGRAYLCNSIEHFTNNL